MLNTKPFDSKVECTRDDSVPFLEFRYRGNRMSPIESVSALILGSMIFTAPLALIPLIRSRRQRHAIRFEAQTLTVGKNQYARERVRRIRTVAFTMSNVNRGNPPVVGIVFDYGTKWKGIAGRLSEPELLWMYDEIQSWTAQHWVDVPATSRY